MIVPMMLYTSQAALQSTSDEIKGVTEAIIIGGSAKVGTGIFDLTHAQFPAQSEPVPFEQSSLLLYQDHHVSDLDQELGY